MLANDSLLRKNYFLSVITMIMLVAAILYWTGNTRLQAFHNNFIEISHGSLKGVQQEIRSYMQERKHMVKVFADEHLQLIQTLAKDPDDQFIYNTLETALRRHFPNHFAFSVTNSRGEPRFEDFDGLVSQQCYKDIKTFATEGEEYLPYVHPNPLGYHFDVMVRYGKPEPQGIFFVSFHADILGSIIDNIQAPTHKIMLINPRTHLIEVLARGARNRVIRNDYHLSAEEQQHIIMRHDIHGTRWQAVDFHNQELHERYRQKLINESVLVFFVFSGFALLLVIRLRKEEIQRKIAERQKTNLMSIITHEFRSPTSVTKSALDFIADGEAGRISDEVRKYLDMASSSTEQLLLLVNDFMDLQQMESGDLSLHKQKCNLNELLEQVVKKNVLYGDMHSVSFNVSQKSSGHEVPCDKGRIEQVLTNLLTNAAKYGADNDVIEVTLDGDDAWCTVQVSDHGAGIPKEFQAHVFEKFTMAKSMLAKKNSRVKSSGLGLSIAKTIVEQHGGVIGFDSQEGKGTTFWFQLPKRQQAEQPLPLAGSARA